jgi:hypothetical protein
MASATDSRKLHNELASGSGTQEYTIETWLIPANTTQEGPARIITYSGGTGERNFMLGQVMYNYVARNRSVNPDVNANGDPTFSTADADEDLQAMLQHVVLTYDQARGRRIFVNGVFTDDEDEVPRPAELEPDVPLRAGQRGQQQPHLARYREVRRDLRGHPHASADAAELPGGRESALHAALRTGRRARSERLRRVHGE